MIEWCCEKCGSAEVYEAHGLVNPNTGDTIQTEPTNQWCEGCEAPCNIIEKERGEG